MAPPFHALLDKFGNRVSFAIGPIVKSLSEGFQLRTFLRIADLPDFCGGFELRCGMGPWIETKLLLARVWSSSGFAEDEGTA